MPELNVFNTDNPTVVIEHTQSFSRIVEILNAVGIHFEQWPTKEGATALEAYQDDIQRIMKQYNFQSVDIINVNNETTNTRELRQKFLDEHTHSEDEVRFFIEGQGLFTLHIDNKIYSILCDKGCFLSVPAGIKHWFDFGVTPNVSVIRFFTNKEGWIAKYTGENTADYFPRLAESIQAKCVVVDIEGTIAPSDFVYQTLFPYARKHLKEFVHAHLSDTKVSNILSDVKTIIKQHTATPERICQQLIIWLDNDQKITPLKTLQGLIWEKGFQSGVLKAPLYDDAFMQLNHWHQQHLPIYSYSSGSIQAQTLYYRYNTHGDLSYLFKQYFDTTIGSKVDASSYSKIATTIGQNPQDIVFFSDNPLELEAALKAGWQCVEVNRDSESSFRKKAFLSINDFRDTAIKATG